ncbi:hypothetical protein, partial [Azotobacter chroococcum]|uniref:hypothetical protein n=1 Tax=Azotobacter chroococcum TaxID=353 RepID=UPI001A9539C1
ESSKINRMHDDSRGQALVCLATANLPASLSVNPLFPTIPRRTYILPIGNIFWHGAPVATNIPDR